MKIFLSIDFYVQIIFILAVCIMEVAAAGVALLKAEYIFVRYTQPSARVT